MEESEWFGGEWGMGGEQGGCGEDCGLAMVVLTMDGGRMEESENRGRGSRDGVAQRVCMLGGFISLCSTPLLHPSVVQRCAVAVAVLFGKADHPLFNTICCTPLLFKGVLWRWLFYLERLITPCLTHLAVPLRSYRCPVAMAVLAGHPLIDTPCCAPPFL